MSGYVLTIYFVLPAMPRTRSSSQPYVNASRQAIQNQRSIELNQRPYNPLQLLEESCLIILIIPNARLILSCVRLHRRLLKTVIEDGSINAGFGGVHHGNAAASTLSSLKEQQEIVCDVNAESAAAVKPAILFVSCDPTRRYSERVACLCRILPQ